MVTAMRCERCGHHQQAEWRDLWAVLNAAMTVPILRRLARIEYLIREGDQAEMTKFEDLQAADAELASNVQELVSGVQGIVAGVDKLDADYDRLVEVVAQGGTSDADLQQVVDSLGASVQQIKDAKASLADSQAKIDADFPAGQEPTEPPTTGDDDGSGTEDGSVPPGTVGA